LAIPTTYFSAQLLLIISFLLLGIWSSTFKMAGNRWRFELFSFDFAIGASLLAVGAAFTLNSGSDLGFSEHMMLSSRTSQAVIFAAGCVFALGNMLLLCGSALMGLSFAYAITTASALLALSAFEFTGIRALFLGVAIGAAVLSIIFQAMGAKSSEATLPGVSLPIMVRKSASGRTLKPKRDTGLPNSTKGIMVTLLGGLALGGIVVPFHNAVFGQFGLGAFAGLVFFFGGVLTATIFLNLFFMNVSIHGGGYSLASYFSGGFGRHLLGIIGGAFCAAGILFLLIIDGFPPDAQIDTLWLAAAALGASLLAIALGLSKWHELSQSPGSAARSLIIGSLLLVVAIGGFAMALEQLPPLPIPGSQTQSPG
jgi:glucose uptake protein